METMNREAWLTELVLRLSPLLEQQGKKMPKFRVSCGWPSTRAKARNGARIGECWMPEASADGTNEIFITPVLGDPVRIADVVLHEMAHAALPPGVGHKAPFAKLAKTLGLEGKPTSTEAGDKLKIKLKEITDELGEYPHAAIDISGRPKQPTRLLKVSCPECGYVIRVTLKWIDEAGYPICPQCNVEMGEEHEAENPLLISEQSVEFEFKNWSDDRFRLRLSKRRNRTQWFVIDYGETGYFAVGQARLVPAESRQNAIEIAESIKEGLLTHEELIEQIPDDVLTEDVETVSDEDWRDLQYLKELEAEAADHQDLILTPEEEAEYERNQASRELDNQSKA